MPWLFPIIIPSFSPFGIGTMIPTFSCLGNAWSYIIVLNSCSITSTTSHPPCSRCSAVTWSQPGAFLFIFLTHDSTSPVVIGSFIRSVLVNEWSHNCQILWLFIPLGSKTSVPEIMALDSLKEEDKKTPQVLQGFVDFETTFLSWYDSSLISQPIRCPHSQGHVTWNVYIRRSISTSSSLPRWASP